MKRGLFFRIQMTALLACVSVGTFLPAQASEDPVASVIVPTEETTAASPEETATAAADPAGESPEEVASVVASSVVTTEEFLADIVKSYEDRMLRSQKYTNPELNDMTDEEYIDAHLYYVEAEKWFCDKYRDAEFEDMNIKYLFHKYLDAVDQEIACCGQFLEDGDFGAWSGAWGRSFNTRADVIVELADLYKAPFTEIDDMRSNVEARASGDSGASVSTSADRATIQKVQQLLNDIGFLCGTPDGDAGARTVSSIRRFQELYEYSPADGVVDDELVTQLETALAEKQGEAAVAVGG